MHNKPSNRFSAGSLIQANSFNGVAIFTGYDLKPGEVRTGRVRIANAGSQATGFRLVEVDATNDFEHADLKLTIQEASDGGSVTVYQGDIGGVPREGIDLGRFVPGEERAYYLSAHFVGGTPNPEQSLGAGAVYEWETIPGRLVEDR